jgi:hypothetical protein
LERQEHSCSPLARVLLDRLKAAVRGALRGGPDGIPRTDSAAPPREATVAVNASVACSAGETLISSKRRHRSRGGRSTLLIVLTLW